MTEEGRAMWAEDRLAGVAERFTPLHRLGWTFLLAWVFCVFYTSAVQGYTGGVGDGNTYPTLLATVFYGSFPLFMSIVMLIAVVMLEKRLGPPSSHPLLVWLAPLSAALSTPLLYVQTPSPALTGALFALGAVLTGVGSGLLWVLWGEYYCMLDRDQIEFITPASSIIAVLLILLVYNLTTTLALIVSSLFPIASGICLFLALRDKRLHPTGADHWMVSERDAVADAHLSARNSPLASLRYLGRTCFGLLAACTVVCIEGSFLAGGRDIPLATVVLLASAALVVAVTIWSTVRARRVNVAFLYRWMCPLLVAGLVCIICLPDGTGVRIAFGVGIAARLAFCSITQMYFANLASHGKVTPTQSYGLGWISVHLGDWLGVMCVIVMQHPLESGAVRLDALCAVLILLLVVATMFVINDTSTFSGGIASEKEVYDEPEPDGTGGAEDAFERGVTQLAERCGLTPREREILDLLAHGRSIPYIRDALVISKNTAITHVKHIYAKLDVHSKQELLDLVQR